MNEQSSQTNPLAIPIAIVVAGVLVAGGLYFGLNGGASSSFADQTNRPAANNGGTANPQTSPYPTQPTSAMVSVDDDPILGDKDAPVTVIEFSDYECPFCQRSFENLLPELKEKYIDTGEVRFVYRDFPLPIHEPAATESAVAANCAFELAGDEAYYKYHDELFPKIGATDKEVYLEIAGNVGLNAGDFESCLDSGDQKSEIEADVQDAQAAGVGGTPTFFVGKTTSDGTIDAEIVVGAVPFTTLDSVIQKYLE